ncbi:electron transport complex subunit RsxB [Burkholderia lata]|uniref:Electron transport complex, RnfABCDGE type, B subunit n=4 Tax=Burkholderia TaxID=32008 RepID=Q39E54_BURL3|nr:electron transport complex subunit RsxB [Burkholderia lata]ABB09262.1 Electron transport complex, RnfABCDGE type, B subunit [Burkholderia lata]
MREIGDNRALANLSDRVRRGREPFGAAAPVVTVTDSKTLADRIEDLLPQTQCTKCGYNGCRPYAEAIAAGDANYNQCPPGGAEGIARLSSLLGKPVIPLNPVNGSEHPRAVAFIDESLCIGCTLCMQACPVDAIVGAPKQMHTIIESLCTGCDLCVPPCPVDCIAMLPVTGERTGWDAWSQEQADAARERHDLRLARQRREREAAEARAAARRAASAAKPAAAQAETQSAAPAAAPAADDAEAKKRAIIAAALERARKKKEELSGQDAGPKNTEGVSAAVQAQIDAAEARRKRLAEQQAQRDAEAAAANGNDKENDAGNDGPGGPSAPPDQNAP